MAGTTVLFGLNHKSARADLPNGEHAEVPTYQMAGTTVLFGLNRRSARANLQNAGMRRTIAVFTQALYAILRDS